MSFWCIASIRKRLPSNDDSIRLKWKGIRDSTTRLVSFSPSLILYWAEVLHQSITCNSYCMHVKEQNENWLLLVIWVFLYCFFFFFPLLATLCSAVFFCKVTLSPCVVNALVAKGFDIVSQYYFCRTSFLLISISLETTSTLMCQFPYFTLARIARKFKIDPNHQFNHSSRIVSYKVAIAAESFGFYYQTKVRIHWGIKTVIWMPTNIDFELGMCYQDAQNAAHFRVSSSIHSIIWKFL